MAGRAVQGRTTAGGLVQDLPYQSYALCCGDGSVWGDGITPVDCALGATRSWCTAMLCTSFP